MWLFLFIYLSIISSISSQSIKGFEESFPVDFSHGETRDSETFGEPFDEESFGFDHDDNSTRIDVDELKESIDSNLSFFLSKNRKPHLSRRTAKHRLLSLITDRFPRLTRNQRRSMRFVMRKASKYELNNAIEIFRKLCPNRRQCELLPPLRFMDSPIQFSRQHRMAMCMIPKNMSTLMTAIMCYLHDKNRIKGVKKRRFYEQWGQNRTCKDNGSKSWRKVEQAVGVNRKAIRKFVLVRNPVERFLSAYEHLCVGASYCLGCQNQACVIETLYQKARQYLNDGKSLTTLKHSVYHFDAHFFPQSWRCDFQTMRTAYTVIHVTSKKQEKLADDMAHYFRWKGVSKEDVRFAKESWIMSKKLSKPMVHNHIANGRNSHSTVDKHRSLNQKDRARLYHTKSTLRKFLSIFYFDYLVLGYSLPKAALI